MPNAIPEIQNEQKQIIRLAAQRRLYSRAKLLFAGRTIFSIALAIGGALVASLCPEQRSLVGLVALPFSVIDSLYFDALQKRWITTAAKIQELFDTHVLGLRWVSIKYGRAPDEEEIIQLGAVIAGDRGRSDWLINWYPQAVARLPIHLARAICQRASCVWDRQLRERYTEAVLAVLILVALAVFVIGLSAERTFEQFVLAVVVPLAPGLLLGIRHFNALRESNRTLQKLSSDADAIWRQALADPFNETQTTEAERDFQSQLYDHRTASQVIFDWLYGRLRGASEAAMQAKAEDLVQEAEARIREAQRS